MSVVNLKLQYCKTACTLVGAEPISSFDGGTRESAVCAAIYESVVKARLEKFPYRFSMKRVKLSPLVGEVVADGYSYVYQLPTDRLRSVVKPLDGLDYTIIGDKLHANVDEFEMEYQHRAAEEIWSHSFAHLIELEIASVLSVALYEDEKKGQSWRNQADRQERTARYTDSQSQPSHRIPASAYALTAVRNS